MAATDARVHIREKALKKHDIRTVSHLFKAHPWKSALISILLMISGLIEGLGVGAVLPLLTLLMRGGMDVAGAYGNTVRRILSSSGVEAGIGLFIVAILTAFLLKAGMTFWAMRYAALTAAGIAVDLRMSLLRSLMGAKWDFFIGHPSGIFASAVGAEAEQGADTYIFSCKILADLIQAAIYLCLVFAISWKISLFALVVGGAAVVVLDGFVHRMRRASVHFVSRFRDVVSHLVDSLQGIKPLKAMGIQSRTESLLAPDINGLRALRLRVDMSRISLDILREPLQLVVAGAGFYLAYRFLHIRFEEASVSLLIFTRILNCLGRLQNNHQNLVRHGSMLHSVQALIEEAESAAESAEGGEIPSLERYIRFHEVSFSRGTNRVLRNVSFEVPAGRLTMLIGSSGAGKTTIADLIVGLIMPDAGEVKIDSRPLDKLDLKAWRAMIGYVPQELFLFHDTILRNITLGDLSISPTEVEAALRATGAWEFVAALPQGIHSVVGERGAKLSGGQRQRIAVARAIVRKPKLLILDEATSGLDPEAEESLFRSLLAAGNQFTILAISHRSCASRIADSIYTVEDGRLVPKAPGA